jgi:hypothetical protein
MAILLALILAQADDPAAVAERLDAAIRSIPGYNAKAEAKPIGDEAFLRRIYRDLVDSPVQDSDVQAFVGDADPMKRAKLIDSLVADIRFDAFWARRFTRVFFGDPDGLRLSELLDKPAGTEKLMIARYEEWLAGRFRKDLPWTSIVSDTLRARGTLEGDPSLGYLVSFYRGDGAPTEFAQGVARHFLGINLYCAKCHDHPFDKWTTDDFYGMAAFVVRQRTGLLNGSVMLRYADEGSLMKPTKGSKWDPPVHMSSGGSIAPRFLFGGEAGKFDDQMNVLSGFMTQRANSQLPRALVNRVWGWLFGVGIVHPADDFNLKNKAISSALLEMLTRDTIDHQYSLKRLLRVICLTQAYQMPTPEEEPGALSLRHVLRARVARGSQIPLGASPARLPLAFDVPAAWTRMGTKHGAKALYVVPGKADAVWSAELTLFEGKMDKTFLQGIRQFVVPRTKSETLEGKTKVTLGELSGSCTCVRGSDGLSEFTTLAALLEFPTAAYTIRLEGPSAVVNEWRDEFIALLKSADLR